MTEQALSVGANVLLHPCKGSGVGRLKRDKVRHLTSDSQSTTGILGKVCDVNLYDNCVALRGRRLSEWLNNRIT